MLDAADIYESEPSAAPAGDAEALPIQRPTPRGPLLDKPPQAAAKLAWKLWKAQDAVMKPLLQQWKANRLRREGIANVQVSKEVDTGKVTVWAPPGARAAAPSMNKAATICRRMTNMLLADLPVPDAQPLTAEDADRDNAELATRLLIDLQSEANGGVSPMRRAIDLSHTYGSGFVREYVVPQHHKGPAMVLASATAVSVEDALQGPAPYVPRYVRPDNTLSDQAGEAKQVWLPGLSSEVLTGRHVRFLPPTADDIWSADGVAIGAFRPIAELKRMFPELREWSKDQWAEVAKVRPDNASEYVMAEPGLRKRMLEQQGDDQLIWTLTVVFKPCAAYDNGCYVVTLGEHTRVYAADWPDDLPLTQVRGSDEGRENPYGVALMENIGGANEVRGNMLHFWLDHLDKFANRRTFLPTVSTLQPSQLQSGTASVLPINPGGQPIYEDIPAPPRQFVEVLEFSTNELNDISGLQETAQALQMPNVNSARLVNAILSQVQAGLSDTRDNVRRAFLRWWRVRLQLARRYMSQMQVLRYAGADGSYKTRAWSGLDLTGEVDVRMAVGSFSSLTPTAKAELASEYLQQGIIPANQAKRIFAANLGGELGVQDDPVTMRIRRQLDAWSEGPQGGDPTQELAAIFDANPSDDELEAATARRTELALFMQGTRYYRFDDAWRQGVANEFLRAKQAMDAAQGLAANQEAAAKGQLTAAQAAAVATGQAPAAAAPESLEAAPPADTSLAMQDPAQGALDPAAAPMPGADALAPDMQGTAVA